MIGASDNGSKPERKPRTSRNGSAKASILAAVQSSGEKGATAADVVEATKDQGIERGYIATQLSLQKRSGVLEYKDGRYYMATPQNEAQADEPEAAEPVAKKPRKQKKPR